MSNETVHCEKCNAEVTIQIAGSYTDILSCNHVIIKSRSNDILSRNNDTRLNPVEAASIAQKLTQTKELPKIDGNELVMRALASANQVYEDFFAGENPVIEDMIKEHGKDNAILVFTAIHAHLSKILFTVNRFRNLYYIKIEQLRKEIEDKAVKELIQNHDFHYENIAPKPKRIVKTPGTKTGTDIDKAKQGLAGLTGKDGKPVDVTKVLANLMWKKKDEDKTEYKEGLDKIKESITKKKDDDSDSDSPPMIKG